MSFYLFIFIGSLVFIAILKSMLHNISDEYIFDSDYASTIDHGRIVDFKENASTIQEKPVTS